jgi:hypothetical protein
MVWNCSQSMGFGVRVAGWDFSIGFRSRMSRTGLWSEERSCIV